MLPFCSKNFGPIYDHVRKYTRLSTRVYFAFRRSLGTRLFKQYIHLYFATIPAHKHMVFVSIHFVHGNFWDTSAIGHVGVLPLVTMFWRYFHHGYGLDYKAAFHRCYSTTVPRLIAHATKTAESQYIPQ